MARVAVVGVGAIGATSAAAVQERGGHELGLCARRPLERVVVERRW
jgi:2-dehydropantoate 2-reductase